SQDPLAGWASPQLVVRGPAMLDDRVATIVAHHVFAATDRDDGNDVPRRFGHRDCRDLPVALRANRANFYIWQPHSSLLSRSTHRAVGVFVSCAPAARAGTCGWD